MAVECCLHWTRFEATWVVGPARPVYRGETEAQSRSEV